MQAKAVQRQDSRERAPQARSGSALRTKGGATGDANVLMRLQRSHGNRHVQRMLEAGVLQRACGCGACSARGAASTAEEDRADLQRKSALVQAKLSVGGADDRYEQEADRVADQVVRKTAAAGSPSVALDGEPILRRDEDESAAGSPLIDQILSVLEQDGVQASSDSGGFDVSADFESELAATKGGGAPIPAPARDQMESAFGADFGGVRLHTDPRAASMSRNINAHAFTHGRDIYFNEGMFNPSTDVGKHLLAHELTHTIQQGEGKIRRLTLTPNLKDKGNCGARRSRWTFSLDSPAPDDGYIVQWIRGLETIEACPSNVSSISLTPTVEYWEAWDVSKNKTVDWTTTRDNWTDESHRGEGTNQSGCQASLGTVKFFLRSVTGDLGGFGTAPAAAGSAWGPGKAPMSGALPSTLTKPSWWDNTPTEGPARRWASSWWNCCGEESKHFSKVDSNP